VQELSAEEGAQCWFEERGAIQTKVVGQGSLGYAGPHQQMPIQDLNARTNTGQLHESDKISFSKRKDKGQ
jgi:hypothetical protein